MERAKLSKYNVRYVSDYAKESTKQGVCARVVLGFSGRVAREGLTGKATFECRPEGGGGGAAWWAADGRAGAQAPRTRHACCVGGSRTRGNGGCWKGNGGSCWCAQVTSQLIHTNFPPDAATAAKPCFLLPNLLCIHRVGGFTRSTTPPPTPPFCHQIWSCLRNLSLCTALIQALTWCLNCYLRLAGCCRELS